jgi:hypothetical protein
MLLANDNAPVAAPQPRNAAARTAVEIAAVAMASLADLHAALIGAQSIWFSEMYPREDAAR